MNACTVRCVPAHLGQTVMFGTMIQDRKRLRRLYADAFVAARMGIDLDVTEVTGCPGVIPPQRMSSAKAIDER